MTIAERENNQQRTKIEKKDNQEKQTRRKERQSYLVVSLPINMNRNRMESTEERNEVKRHTRS